MKVDLTGRYPLGISCQQAWQLLSSIEEIARCVPGAVIGEQVDSRRYQGTLEVRIEPVSARFVGEIEVRAIDPRQRRLNLRAKGADREEASAAALALSARLRDAAGGCELDGEARMTVNGRLADLGRPRIAQAVEQALQQFVDNLCERAAAPAGAAQVIAATRKMRSIEDPPPASLGYLLSVLWRKLAGLFKRRP